MDALRPHRQLEGDVVALRQRAGLRAENWREWRRALDADPDTVFVWRDVPDPATADRTRAECAPEQEALTRELREGLAANRRARGLAP